MPAPEIEQRFRDELTIWLATVSPQGRPAVRPVWFLWTNGKFLIYSQPGRPKVRHIEANPHVCLHLDPDEWGGSVVIVPGEARLAPERPPADEQPGYLDKYGPVLERYGFTAAGLAADYSLAIEVAPGAVRSY